MFLIIIVSERADREERELANSLEDDDEEEI